VATPIITPGGQIPAESQIYRALNPKHLEDGMPGENHFDMKQNHLPGDGVSTGIASRICVAELRSIEAIRQLCGDDCAVAELSVADVLAPVPQLGLTVVQQDALEWGVLADAHAVITGYQILIGREGKRRIRDFQRHLVKLARKRYYPAGSSSALSIPDSP
jgi:hypothetical protein